MSLSCITLKTICKLTRYVHLLFKDAQMYSEHICQSNVILLLKHAHAKFLPKGRKNGLHYDSMRLQKFHMTFPIVRERPCRVLMTVAGLYILPCAYNFLNIRNMVGCLLQKVTPTAIFKGNYILMGSLLKG